MAGTAQHLPVTGTPIKLTRSKLVKLHGDAQKSAAAINLVYITDLEPGIERTGQKDNFSYSFNGKPVKDTETLDRIKKLVIPPAWQNVWISPFANSHLQVTGTDIRGRKQYKYHSLWNTLRNQTKFFHLRDFGNALPGIRQTLQKHLSHPGYLRRRF